MRKILKSLLIFVLFVSCFAMAFFVVQEDMGVADAAISKTMIKNNMVCYDKGSTYYHKINVYICAQDGNLNNGVYYIASNKVSFYFERGDHKHGSQYGGKDDYDMSGTVTFRLVSGTTTIQKKSYEQHYDEDYNDTTDGLAEGVDSATVSFANLADGKYQLYADVHYYRGNTAPYQYTQNDIKLCDIEIDTIAPEISSAVANNGITTASFNVTATDTNLTMLSYMLQATQLIHRSIISKTGKIFFIFFSLNFFDESRRDISCDYKHKNCKP